MQTVAAASLRQVTANTYPCRCLRYVRANSIRKSPAKAATSHRNKLVRMGRRHHRHRCESKHLYSFNTPGMYRAGIDKTGKIEIAIFR